MSIFQNKFKSDVLWNMVSFAILGVSGILINILIGHFYGSETLGVFNQVFAIYIFVSQLSVFGIQFSTLKHISEYSSDLEKCKLIVGSALITTLFISAIVIAVSFLTVDVVGGFFNSSAVKENWKYIIPALLFFSINKIYLNILNGFRLMKLFAAAQSLRYISILFFLSLLIITKDDGSKISVILTYAEIVLFCFLSVLCFKYLSLHGFKSMFQWIDIHLKFGLKSFLSGTIGELNSRVDILILGLLVSDQSVGIYSMASVIVEGLFQLAVVLRNNINPLITNYYFVNEKKKLKRILLSTRNYYYVFMVIIAALSVYLYPLYIEYIVKDFDFLESCLLFNILIVGLVFCSGYLPINMVFVQCGFPGYQTAYKASIILFNIILNLILIPFYGMTGAAVATSLSFILSVVILKKMVQKKLRIFI